MGKKIKIGGCMPLIALAAIVLTFVLAILSFYPRAYSEIIEKCAQKYGLEASLIYAVIKTESGYNKNALSHKGAKGLMQIMDKTGEWGFSELNMGMEFKPETLFEPEVNIEIGCWYLSKLFAQFEDTDTVLAAYNAGSGNVSNWLKNPDYYDGSSLYNIPFSETRVYVKRVNANRKIYEKLRGIAG